MNIESLTNFERNELLRFFLHHMPMEQRMKLAKTYPQHYRKMAEWEKVLIQFPTLAIETHKSEVDIYPQG